MPVTHALTRAVRTRAAARARVEPTHEEAAAPAPVSPDPTHADLAGPDLASPDLASPDLASPDLAGPRSARTKLARTKLARAEPVRVVGIGHRPRIAGPATVELTVVVPFFNPGAALRPTVTAVVDHLVAAGVDFEVVAVCDGSTDGSAETITDIPHVRLLRNDRNQGKGVALRRGFAHAGGAWIGFIDADGDIDPRHILDYLHLARQGGNAGVYADKRHADSGNVVSGARKAMSVTYSTFVTTLFRLGVRDTQTGCKILRRDVVAQLLPGLRERGFALDLELFVAARRAGITDFVGAPVTIEGRQCSTVCPLAVLRTIRDTFVVYRRHRRAGR